MILTGSNTGGKSTFMKGVAYNLYLAQTICLAPSKRLTFTPFGYIGSSLNVSDSQSDDISTFKAEAIRAKNLYTAAQASNQTFFAFVIIDELFKGTNPKSGGTACYAFAKQLSAALYTIFIFASHFTDAITKVEEATNGVCANFKLEISPEEKYKLKPGINSIDTAPDILRKEFADINPQFFDGFFEA
jgi:DNA mismatch repair ATPase MutS